MPSRTIIPFPLYGGRLGWGSVFELTPHLYPSPSATKRGEIHPQSVLGRIAPTFAKGWRNPTNHAKVCGGLCGEQGGRKSME